MNFFYPRFPTKRLPTMARIALLGAIVAGCYCALHDQVGYAISPEYFTKLEHSARHFQAHSQQHASCMQGDDSVGCALSRPLV